ncbi:MAG: DUF4349 domain-containing protein [Phycisphaeraceae bacterium]
MLIPLQRLSCALVACLSLLGCAASPNAYRSLDAAASPSMLAEQRAVAASNPAGASDPTFTTAAHNPGEQPDAFRPLIIYTAELGLKADRVELVQAKAERVIETKGGYIGESSPGRLVLRVPAAAFEEALDVLAGLGEVTTRRVFAQDATERVVDLESRLRSAQTLRDRLIEMVKGAENLEHALKVEQELARVTEQIELIQGRLRLAKQQIAYATITLTIQATPSEQRLTPGIPIAWVRDLGEVFHERQAIDVTGPRRLRDGVSVELPEGFIRYFQEAYVTQAVDANGVRVRVRKFKNFDEGALTFWQRLTERSLKQIAELELVAPEAITLERGGPGRLIKGHKQIAGETVRYLIALGVSDDGDYVYAFEAWGVAEYYDETERAILDSIKTMRCY